MKKLRMLHVFGLSGSGQPVRAACRAVRLQRWNTDVVLWRL